MVLFGEVVFPSSRVLWDLDDDEEFVSSDNTETLSWAGNSVVPSEISTLLIFETSKLTSVAKRCLIDNYKPACELQNVKVSIQQLSETNYVVLCDDANNVNSGEVVDQLIPWLMRSRNTIVFNSSPKYSFVSKSNEDLPNCFIRMLSTENMQSTHVPWLEMPNLITGISAGVLSYCNHMNLPALVYTCYMDSLPLDSTTAKPILDLIQKHNVPLLKNYKMKSVINRSNLYM